MGFHTMRKSHGYDLTPIVSQHNPNLYRVILDKKPNGTYEFFVGDSYMRVFTDETLPDEVKAKIAMINAAGKEPYPEYQSVYNTSPYEEMREIGWKKENETYCIVLSSALLHELRGEK